MRSIDKVRVISAALAVLLSGAARAQGQDNGSSGQLTKSATAIGYQLGTQTKVDLQATSLAPQANGEAKVEAKKGVTNIEISVKKMIPPSNLGTEFLTYVLWVISPEGRTSNVGEIQINSSGEGNLKATTQSQTFSLVVTAEPYFGVRQPSEILILENVLRKDTKGRIFQVKEYQLLKRAQYQKMGNPLALTLDLKSVPLEMYEARNAVEIASSRGAGKYAPEIFSKAEAGLKIAENSLTAKADRKEIISRARSTVQSAEDARALAVTRQEEERIAAERAAAAATAKAEAESKARAEAQRQAEIVAAREAEAKRRADEEARRQAEVAAAKEARLKAEAETAALKARMEAESAAAKAKAEADALKAKEEAANAEALKARQAAEQLRSQLLDQLNRVLETRDTPRGLVVTMADVLFDTGKYDLRQPTREKLARLGGIVLAHQGLKLEIEGHTDSTGSDELNQKLSEQRASTTRSYLVEQGLSADSITAIGLGKTMPVADNTSAAGRQQNRRVEIIVSGEVIGTQIGK